MDKRDAENAKLGAKTLSDFFNQFGNDEAAMIMLELLFEGLMNEENLFVFGQQEQTGNQDDHSPEG